MTILNTSLEYLFRYIIQKRYKMRYFVYLKWHHNRRKKTAQERQVCFVRVQAICVIVAYTVKANWKAVLVFKHLSRVTFIFLTDWECVSSIWILWKRERFSIHTCGNYKELFQWMAVEVLTQVGSWIPVSCCFNSSLHSPHFMLK